MAVPWKKFQSPIGRLHLPGALCFSRRNLEGKSMRLSYFHHILQRINPTIRVHALERRGLQSTAPSKPVRMKSRI